jgi:hypothetical protein
MLFWAKSTYRPYLKEGRLPNVLAALQVMATAVRSERTIENWAFVLDRNREISTVDKWKTVFKEHQEFFLTYLSDEKDMAALRWRYVTKLYDAKTGKYPILEEKEHLLEDEEHPESAAPLARLPP